MTTLINFLKRDHCKNTYIICVLIICPFVLPTGYFILIGTGILSMYMFNGKNYDFETGRCTGGWFCPLKQAVCSYDTDNNLFGGCFAIGIIAFIVYILMVLFVGCSIWGFYCICVNGSRYFISEWSKSKVEIIGSADADDGINTIESDHDIEMEIRT